MPPFSIAGDPGSVRAKASEMRTRATTFVAIADGLASVSTSGWSGRAADRFRERFDVEPPRWRAAGDGFFTAAGALEGWASTLSWAQGRAIWCTQEWARGDQATAAARAAYDAQVRAAHRRADAWEAAYGEGTYTLTIEPFVDPGQAIRDNAEAMWSATLKDVESAAAECASGVRAGAVAAPASRNWLETGLAAVGGFFAGAGEAIWDLGSMIVHISYAPLFDLFDLATGNLTPEEMAARNNLRIEQAQAMWNALKSDPWEFGKQVGKAVLDWDTWTDDPARALGHLVPDAIAAVATGGSSAAATRGGSAVGALARHADDLADGMADASRAVSHLDDVTVGARLDDFADALDDLGDVRAIHSASASASDLDMLVSSRYRDILGVNRQRFHEGVPGSGLAPEQFQSNCTRCVLSVERSLQGAPVSAMPMPPGVHGAPLTDVTSAIGRSFEPMDSYADIARRVVAEGDGARGIVYLGRGNSVGHVFNVINDGGTVVFLDGQTGKIATLGKFANLGYLPTHP